MAARVRLFALVGLTGVASWSASGVGPYMYRFSIETSFAPAAAAPARTPSWRGERFRPVPIARVEAVVDDCRRPGAHLTRKGWVGGVAPDELRTRRGVRLSASVHDANPPPLLRERVR